MALPGNNGGDFVQMRLSYSPLAPIFLFLIEWMDYSFMDVIPSYLGLLHILINKVGETLFQNLTLNLMDFILVC